MFLAQQLQRLLGLVLVFGVPGHQAQNVLAKYILLYVQLYRQIQSRASKYKQSPLHKVQNQIQPSVSNKEPNTWTPGLEYNTNKYKQIQTNPFTQDLKPNTTKCVRERTKYLDTRFKNSSPVLEDFIHNLTEGRNSVHSRLPSLDKAFIGMLTRKSTGKEKLKATFNSLKSRSQGCSFPRAGCAHLWISRDYLSHLKEKNGGEVENI